MSIQSNINHSWPTRWHRSPGKKLPPGVIEQALPRVKFTDEPLESTLMTMAQWAFELHVINQPPSLTGLVDTTILKQVQQESK